MAHGATQTIGDTSTRHLTAARVLLRDSVLDTVHDLLLDRDWSAITMADVAGRVGISRQTVYNEFGSKAGVAAAYALRITDRFVDRVQEALWAHAGDIPSALTAAFAEFLAESSIDPLIRSLVASDAHPDLLRLVTVESRPFMSHAATKLARVFRGSWLDIEAEDADVLARAIARLSASFISMPRESPFDIPTDMAKLFTPYLVAADPANR